MNTAASSYECFSPCTGGEGGSGDPFFPPSSCRVRHRLHLLLVFQDGIVGLVDVLGHFWSSAFQGELWRGEERLVLGERGAGVSCHGHKGQLGMGWTGLLTITQSFSPAFSITDLELPFQSLLQAGGGKQK